MKKFFAIMLMLCLTLTCVAAGAESAATGHKVGFIQLTLQSNYHATMSDHFAEIAAAAGMEAVMTNAEWATETQLQLCEDLIAQGCEAIILNPVGDEVVPVIQQQCAAAGIPLICVDNTSPGTGYTYVGIDNFAIARGIGKAVAEKYSKGNIVYARSTATDTGCPAYRFGGLMGGLSDEGEVAGYKLIDERYAQEVTFDEGMRQTEEMLAANSQIDIIFTHRDGQALGALTAVRNAGREDVKVITGFDGELALLEAIAAWDGTGPEIITGLNSPVMVADMTMQALETYFAGGDVASSYYTPVVVVTHENAQEYLSYGF